MLEDGICIILKLELCRKCHGVFIKHLLGEYEYQVIYMCVLARTRARI